MITIRSVDSRNTFEQGTALHWVAIHKV
jgi:hypothetical protein